MKRPVDTFPSKTLLVVLIHFLISSSCSLLVHGFVPFQTRTIQPQLRRQPQSQIQMVPYDSILPSIATAYTTTLMDYPMPTKSATASILCGLGDYIAQRRDPSISATDWNRLLRFSIKGLGGGIIWAIWYDTVDGIVDSFFLENSSSSFDGDSVVSPKIGGNINDYLKIGISMIMEQFLWCPIVFGLWEIPVASLMNGGKVQTIPGEVRGKLGGLLIDNAKVWTPANLLIYSAPLEFRLGLSNLVDILWQSVVADMAASCGDITVAVKRETGDPGVAMVTTFLNKEKQPDGMDKAFSKRREAPSTTTSG